MSRGEGKVVRRRRESERAVRFSHENRDLIHKSAPRWLTLQETAPDIHHCDLEVTTRQPLTSDFFP